MNKKSKVKRNFLKLIFGTRGVMVLLILIQIAVLILFYLLLKNYGNIPYMLLFALGMFLVLYVLNSDIDSGFKISWIIPLITLPVLGTYLYLFFHLQDGQSKINKKINGNIDKCDSLLTYEKYKLPGRISGISSYLKNIAKAPTYAAAKDSVKYFPTGETVFEAIKSELQKAHKFIFIEYFIIEDGAMWGPILDILKKKAKEGVDVRVMYDGTNSIIRVPFSYPKKLAEYGVKCKVFSPIKPFLSSYQNNRDHRKLMIIDGETGFTGGINLADEYINEIELFGKWKDNGLMLKGESVKSLTAMFLELWNLTSDISKDLDYLKTDLPKEKTDENYIIPYADSPLDSENIGKQVYINAIDRAESYVYIATPYFIPDSELLGAIKFASKRGVDVRIILPHIPDKKIAFYIAQSYYPVLLKAGVKIYEYEPGFIHSKMLVSDDELAVVGTINMDYRSLYLHFENAVLLYGCDCISNIKDDFIETFKLSVNADEKYYESVSPYKKAVGHVFRLFSPFL